MIRRGIPFMYYLLTALTGIASAICLNGLFRQYRLLFGTHTVSTITILVAGFTCLALGSYFTGKLADKSINRLRVFSSFSIVSGIYFFLHPFIYRLITTLVLNINTVQEPGQFSGGILKFALSFVVLLVPAGLLAGSILLPARHFIRHISHSGRFMSATLFSVSVGILTGLLFSTLFMIPTFGMHITIFSGALFQLLAAVLSFYYMYKSRSAPPRTYVPLVSKRARRTSLRFRKKKVVLEAGAILTRAMMHTYFIQGFTLTSAFLVCLRMLENYRVLKPVYFYAVVWTIVLSGFATGSGLYKRISEKPANKFMTLATLQIFTGFAALLSYALLEILNSKGYIWSRNASTFAGLLLRQGLLFSALLLIPSILTGLSFPLAGKIYPRRIQKIGDNFGHLGSILFLSALAGTLIVPLILIPLIGQHYAYLLLAFLTIYSGIYLIYKDSRLIRGFRLSYAFLTLILFLIIAGAFHTFKVDLRMSPVDRKIEGNTAFVGSVARPDKSRIIYLNGNLYVSLDQNDKKAQLLPAFLPLIVNQNIKTALVIGFGTGLTASGLEEKGVQNIHITDIFPEVIRISSDVYADDNNDIMSNSKVDITVEAARSYLYRSSGKIDLITAETNQLRQMPDNYTFEFYRLCYGKLSANGLLCQILPIIDITGIEIRSLLKSCAVVFPNVTLWYISPEKILLLASKNQRRYEFCDLLQAYTVMNVNNSFTNIGIPNIESLLAHAFLEDNQVRDFIGDAPDNSDTNPFVEFYKVRTEKKTDEVKSLIFQARADYSRIIHFQAGCVADTAQVINNIKRFNQKLLPLDVQSSGLQE